MKKIYAFTLLAFLITGCSKDFLKKYDTRIEGTWQLVDVDRRGVGGGTSHLAFTGGQFIFGDDGSLTYNSPAGDVYKGSWDIKKRQEDGNQVHTLLLSVVDYTSQDVKSEYFDEIVFTGTNHFKAYINDDFHNYVFRFTR